MQILVCCVYYYSYLYTKMEAAEKPKQSRQSKLKIKSMKTKIELKRINGEIFFSHECEDNSVVKTIDALRRTSFGDFDLSDADLSYANLSNADLSSANLSSADLRSANLSGADLSGADLSSADLRSANLSSADLCSANLSSADLRSADLRSANLSSADLRSANLSYAKHNECTGFLLPQCPSEGSFVAWKKAGGKVVKLLITDDAKRSSATTLKCRCSKAKVLGIENLDGTDSGLTEIKSNHDENFIYRVGEIVEVDNFDEDRFNECSTGIHFFIAREMAVKY